MSFLFHAWYAAAWSDELTDGLLGRRILDLPVLLLRDRDGAPVAVGDRCPHRFAPLHRGRVVDGVVECAYHGIRFDGAGACVAIPGADGQPPPKNMRLPTYPLVERDGVIWIWPSAEPPELGLVPDLREPLRNPSFCAVTGHMRVGANYELLADNLIDPSHGQFLHGSLLRREGFFDVPHEVRQEGMTVSSERVIRDVAAPAAYAPYLPDPSARVDWFTRAQWDPPGIFRLDNGVTPVGHPRDEGVRRCGVHLITPETTTSTHYFYSAVRNYLLGDAATDEASRTWQRTVFEEQDRPMLEAVQEMMGTPDFASLHPVLVATDQPATRIRAIMRRLIAEREPASA